MASAFRPTGAVRTRTIVIVGVLLLVGLVASTQVCLSAGFRWGLWVNQCPDGSPRLTVAVSAPGLKRGAESDVHVAALAHYTTGDADERRSTGLSDFDAELVLVGPSGETKLAPVKGWKEIPGARFARVALPAVPDGDYLLRAKVKSRVGDGQLELPLPLYAPARIHVLTDRPLYEAGHVVKFRAVALRATDLAPLDGRPGRWVVRAPDGTVLLEERAPAGEWGVASGSFPLDRGADTGDWTVTWSSGGAEGARAFTVKPFTLPRFRVEAQAEKPFYRRLERPRIQGSVRYASGAPVAGARVEAQWSVGGEWPAPTGWTSGAVLPKEAKTDAAGRFTLDLPSVPDDLQGQATVQAALAVVDESGDRVEGAASVLLSQDAIRVSAITELEGGLLQGFNNRLYVRATTADGRVLPGATLHVKRAWEARDKGTETVADEDGVAALQVDPGPAVNVVIPPMPFRPPPPVKAARRVELRDLLTPEGEAGLGERLALDRAEAELGRCARFLAEPDTVAVGLRVAPSGAVQSVATPQSRVGRCVGQALQGVRFPAGKDRVLGASFALTDEELPQLSLEVDAVPALDEDVLLALEDALLDVRDCLPSTVPSATLPSRIVWQRQAKSRTVELSWVKDPQGEAFPDGPLQCLASRLQRVELPKPPPGDTYEGDEASTDGAAVGTAHLSVTAPEKYVATRPRATVMQGYEFLVTAKAGKETVGQTKLRLRPGDVPPLRLRTASQLLEPGQSFELAVLRGPDFQGELPEKGRLVVGREHQEFDVDRKARTAKVQLPANAEGWASVSVASATLFLFVQPRAQLTVALKPEQERYAPGQLARLELQTTLGGAGKPAAVGLFGVDDSLSQLAPLPGADELAGLRPQAQSEGSFDGMDAAALSLGRVRGRHAAAATLLKVSALPPPVTVETAVALNGQTVFDPNETLTDRFYSVLLELHVQARTWETKAPPAEKMTPATMARLWKAALDALDARKEPNTDVWGRRLRLHRLPADLLALTDPRAVVIQGTRLPEDVENWSAWVAKEKP